MSDALKGPRASGETLNCWKIEVSISRVALAYWVFERSVNIYKGKVFLVETCHSFREVIGSERQIFFADSNLSKEHGRRFVLFGPVFFFNSKRFIFRFFIFKAQTIGGLQRFIDVVEENRLQIGCRWIELSFISWLRHSTCFSHFGADLNGFRMVCSKIIDISTG